MGGKNLSKNAGIFMGAQLAAQAVGMVSSMALARWLSKEDMGYFGYLMSTYFFLSSFLILGLPSSLTYFYPTVDEKKRATAVYTVVGGLTGVGLLLGAAAFFGARVMAAYWKKDELVELFQAFSLYFTFTLAMTYMKRFLVSTGRYRVLAAWLPFDRVTNLLAFAIPAYMKCRLKTILISGVVVNAAEFVLVLMYTFTVISPLRFAWDSKLIRRILYYSVPLGLSTAVAHIGGFVDKTIIGRYESPELFAVFNWGAQGIKFVPDISMMVMTVLLPELARLHSDGNYRQLLFLWHESIRKVALIVVGVVAFAEFFAEPFIVTLYSDAYLASVPYFRIFQIRLILRVTLFGYLLQSIGKTRMILYITIGAIIFKVPVSIGLYKLMGPYGPACSSIVVAASMTAYHMWYVARAVKAPVKRVWPWLVHIKIIAAGFAAAAVSAVTLFIPTAKISAILSGMWPWLSDKTSATSLMQLVIGGVVFAPLYVVFLALTGTIRKKDFELLKSMTVGRFMKKRDNGKAPEKPDE